MYIYYPSDATVYTRQVNNGELIEEFINYAPDQVIIIPGGTSATASTAFLTSSLSTTSSYATSASYAISASNSEFAINSKYAQTSSVWTTQYTLPTFYSSSWSWTNQRGSVVSQSYNLNGQYKNIFYIPNSGGGGDNASVLTKPLLSTPYTLILGFRHSGLVAGNYTYAGIAIQDSSGRMVTFNVVYNSGWHIGAYHYNNVTSFASSVYEISLGTSVIHGLGPYLLGLNDDGTNFNFYLSTNDGASWSYVAQESRTAWLSSPLNYGILGNGSQTLSEIYELFHWSENIIISPSSITPLT